MNSSTNRGGFEMYKERYEHTEMEIISFQTQDVIITSGLDEYEDDIIGQNQH